MLRCCADTSSSHMLWKVETCVHVHNLSNTSLLIYGIAVKFVQIITQLPVERSMKIPHVVWKCIPNWWNVHLVFFLGSPFGWSLPLEVLTTGGFPWQAKDHLTELSQAVCLAVHVYHFCYLPVWWKKWGTIVSASGSNYVLHLNYSP